MVRTKAKAAVAVVVGITRTGCPRAKRQNQYHDIQKELYTLEVGVTAQVEVGVAVQVEV